MGSDDEATPAEKRKAGRSSTATNASTAVDYGCSCRTPLSSKIEGTVRIELTVAKKRQGEVTVDIQELTSLPLHKKIINEPMKGSINIKGYVQLLCLGNPETHLQDAWVYEEVSSDR